MTDLHILDVHDYYQSLLEELPKAKERIVVAAMLVMWGDKSEPLFKACLEAAKRGVKITVLVDIYTAAPSVNGLKRGKVRWQRTAAFLQRLTDLGGTVYRVGKLGLVPYRGRCHVKVTIVDDHAYSFGGVNFDDEDFANNDYMMRTQSKPYADCLAQLVDRIGHATGPLPNGEVQLESGNIILFDGGRVRDSIIYQKACELAAQATRAYYVSQYAVSGALAKLLADIDTVYYTNRPEQVSAPASWGQAFDLQRFRTPNSYTGSKYLHAKFILFELPGGRKALVGGSNNFSYRGVAYGTKEIALYSTNKKLWQELYDFMDTHVRKTGRR